MCRSKARNLSSLSDATQTLADGSMEGPEAPDPMEAPDSAEASDEKPDSELVKIQSR